jgi:Asp-tRNA(Asn)/Glu-tRNA(Gln) amidotransferase A subunit family amidase
MDADDGPDLTLSRRDVLLQLTVAALGLPWLNWFGAERDPLLGSIAAMQAGRAQERWSAEEITRRALARCEQLNPVLRAIDQLSPTALDDARASDARLRAGQLRGPLDGVPVFAKSIYDVAGLPTTGSNAEWARLFPSPATRDATEVARLRASGAVILGKTAADDFAHGGDGASSLTGQVRNPYDPSGTRTPGGSSAGSAVAVACGMAFAALGTDDGGSNRIPAQFCGVVGMKPTFGLVPRSGVLPTWPALDTHGPLARSVGDAALLLDVLAGPDGIDTLAIQRAWQSGALGALPPRALRSARLGVVDAHIPREQMSAESLALWDRALADLRASGAIITPFRPSVTRHTVRDLLATSARTRADLTPNATAAAPTANALARYFAFGGTDATAGITRGLAAYRAFYDVLPAAATEALVLAAQPLESDGALQAFLRARNDVLRLLQVDCHLQRVDAMIYPTMPFPAPNAGAAWPDIRTALGFGNQLGLPEVSVPTGIGADGVPGGNVSFVGLPGDDRQLLALAAAYERRARRYVVPPTIAGARNG